MNTYISEQTITDVAGNSRTIDALHRTKTGKVSNKWSSYLIYYDQLFEPIKDTPLIHASARNSG